jgi:hypothetical protein
LPPETFGRKLLRRETPLNRALYFLLWVLEILLIVGLVLALALPIQDYALREFIAWQQHASPATYTAFLE